MTSRRVCVSTCRYHHLTILAYMFIGGINWHPFMISGVAWNYCIHSVSPARTEVQPANAMRASNLQSSWPGSPALDVLVVAALSGCIRRSVTVLGLLSLQLQACWPTCL